MSEKKTGIIYGVNGPVIYLKGNKVQMSEMVYGRSIWWASHRPDQRHHDHTVLRKPPG
ncbi:MAG: hypothetical protein ACLUOI_33515 [Eisenbergiella sp.]